MVKIISIGLIAYLFALLQNPTNVYLQRFDIIVVLWCNVIFFVICFGCVMCLIDEFREKLKKTYKNKTLMSKIIDYLLTLSLLILLILNGFSYCFIICALSCIISYLIKKILKKEMC